jgi:NDP-sugar pyrophosphorylase family protein
MLSAKEFFDLEDLSHRKVFSEDKAVWTGLDRLHDYLETFFSKSWPLSTISGQIDSPIVIYEGKIRKDIEIKTMGSKGSVQAFAEGEVLEGAAIIMPGAFLFDDRIIIGPGTVVEPGALIKGPAIIGKNSEIRQGAYMRGDCLVGDGCIVGHATEMKASIMLDGSQAGHFAYIGDSILGRNVNLGAGTKLANLRMIPGTVTITVGRKRYNTNRRKLGAILGDRTETGCNSVMSPGTLLGPRSIVYPAIAVPGGYYPGRNTFMPPKDSPRIRRSKKDRD